VDGRSAQYGIRVPDRRGVAHFSPIAGKAKDVAAGAVLLTAIGAVIIGALVFGPKVRALFT
jgi:diacylglycerol kinase